MSWLSLLAIGAGCLLGLSLGVVPFTILVTVSLVFTFGLQALLVVFCLQTGFALAIGLYAWLLGRRRAKLPKGPSPRADGDG